MTTPTTPAADAPSDVQLMVALYQQIKEGAARESALIAERDALLIAGGDLANCAYNLAQRAGEVLSIRDAEALDKCRRKWDATLSAPAVEGV